MAVNIVYCTTDSRLFTNIVHAKHEAIGFASFHNALVEIDVECQSGRTGQQIKEDSLGVNFLNKLHIC